MSDLSKIRDILNANQKVPFVQRILKPLDYPVLKNPDGSVSTHSMSYGEADGKYYVYPTVMMNSAGSLQRYPDNEAWRRASGTGNIIEFKTENEAKWFTENYKRVWGGKIPK
jgi:hypothetical protein